MSKKDEEEFYEDKNGYVRENNHSNAWHRKVAYHKIYMKNRKKYKLPFSKYEIHQIDGDKKNNLVENLALLTTEEHIDLHQIVDKKRRKGLSWREACSDAWYEFTIEKEAKREKEYLESLESQEEVYEYLLEKAGVEFEDGSIGLLMDEDEDFIKEVLTFYQVTGRKITKKEIKEIVSNKEEFKKIIKEQEEKKKKKVEEEMLKRYEAKKKEVEERHKGKSNKKIEYIKETKPNRKKYFIIGAIILVIVIIVYFILNNAQKFDKGAVNLNVKEGIVHNPQIDLLCDKVCVGTKIYESNGYPHTSVIRCYCGAGIWFFDLRTNKQISEKEVIARNKYYDSNKIIESDNSISLSETYKNLCIDGCSPRSYLSHMLISEGKILSCSCGFELPEPNLNPQYDLSANKWIRNNSQGSVSEKELKNVDKQNTAEEIKLLIVEGSRDSIIIINNKQEFISLNITYRIYSKWYGADYQATQIFDINPNNSKSFKVYNNDGCSKGIGDCSVSIISYEEV